MEKNRYVHYGLVLTGIAFISALILATVNQLTVPLIEANANKVINLARTKVLPEAKLFIESEKKETSGLVFIPGKNTEGVVVGYVVTASENGYAGAIQFVLGIDKVGKITGLDIVSSQETPGLGSKIAGEEWKAIWRGRDSTYKFEKATDAFAGATISPQAVYTGIIKVLNVYEKEVK
ncbi:MAG: RnfABCDGE type electron transport complex subunit G [Fusobacteriaceae bacterium]